MSCVCILTPVVIAAWPVFSAAVAAAATSLGYAVVEEGLVVRASDLGACDQERPQLDVVAGLVGERRARILVVVGTIMEATGGDVDHSLRDFGRARQQVVTESVHQKHGEPAHRSRAGRELQRVRASNKQPEIESTIRAELSDREIEVLKLIANGKDNAMIAAELHISPKTVKNHISNILMKLQIDNRIQAAVYAVRSGIV